MGFVWVGQRLVNNQFISLVEVSESGGTWFVKVYVAAGSLAVDYAASAYTLPETFTTEADAQSAAVNIAAGTYAP